MARTQQRRIENGVHTMIFEQLSDSQTRALKFLADQQDDSAVREQMASLLGTDGSPTMAELRLDSVSLPLSNLPDGPGPGVLAVVNADQSLVGEILLWIEGGLISAVEQTWYGENPPVRLPDRNSVATYAELGL